jgi:hypothetical protein
MENTNKTSPVLIGLSWAFVSIPLIWGIAQVVVKTLAIFT